MNITEIRNLNKRYKNYADILNSLEFDGKKTPSIGLFDDDCCYFDSDNNNIHIGTAMFTSVFDVQNEEEYLMALQYIYGHEAQHCHSTSDTPYRGGIIDGTRVIVEYIANELEPSSKRRFRNENDCKAYLQYELPKKYGIYVSYYELRQLVAEIANSIEDGRIERIRGGKFPGYENLRTFFRWRFWNREYEYPSLEETEKDPYAKLVVVLNQTLYLATCQLYQKGFASAFASTMVMDEVNKVIPYVTKGVMASTCRKMSDQLVNICGVLAPMIFQAIKTNPKDMLQQLMQQIVHMIIEESAMESGPHKSEKSEEKDESGSTRSALPKSDLPMDNETESESGSGLSDSDADNKDNKDGEKDSGKSGNEKSDDTSKDSDSQNSGASSQEGKSEQEGDGSENGNNNESKNSDKEKSSSSGNQKNGSEKQGSSESEADTENSMEASVEDAYKSAKNSVSQQIQRETNSNIKERVKSKKKDKLVEKPISESDFKDIHKNFEEVRRTYKLTEKTPAVIQARINAFARKNKQYLKSLSAPNVTRLNSGSVDPSLLYGLSYGNIDIFRKTGYDKKFDGCVYLLIDNSGSMYGAKRLEACKAAAVVEGAFQGLMPMKIVAFDYKRGPYHDVVKDWNEHTTANCCWNFAQLGKTGNGNEDGYDIEIATREILARPEKKKLIIVLSDGAPGEPARVRRAVTKARKNGVSVYSIYFEDYDEDKETFAWMYQKDYICCELSEVDDNLSRLIKKFSRS